jgi:hypothetical protein
MLVFGDFQSATGPQAVCLRQRLAKATKRLPSPHATDHFTQSIFKSLTSHFGKDDFPPMPVGGHAAAPCAGQQMLHFWKPLSEIPSLENFIQAQTRRPFESTQQPPPEPV